MDMYLRYTCVGWMNGICKYNLGVYLRYTCIGCIEDLICASVLEVHLGCMDCSHVIGKCTGVFFYYRLMTWNREVYLGYSCIKCDIDMKYECVTEVHLCWMDFCMNYGYVPEVHLCLMDGWNM